MTARLPVALGIALTLFSACEKTPEAADPCAGIGPFRVSIAMAEARSGLALQNEDTVILNSAVAFKAMQPEKGYYARYRWKIGTDPEEKTEKDLEYTFFSARYRAGDLVRIKLIGETTINNCVPGDDGIDSIETTIRLASMKDAAIIGKYKGLFQSDRNRTDTQQVEIRYFPPDRFYEDGHLAMFNIQKGCNMTISNPNMDYWYNLSNVMPFFSHRFAQFIAPGTFYNGCLGPNARFELKAGQRDSLTVRFDYAPDFRAPNARVSDVFRGARVR